MRQALAILYLFVLLLGCEKDSNIQPGEVEASITGYVIADNWGKGCGIGGFEIKIGNDPYIISNTIPVDYENANSWPVPVWVRYQSANPDSCAHWTNRITVLSIRKR